MVWQSYESQKLIPLDEPMAEQLSQYLENKESNLSTKIIEILMEFEGMPLLQEPPRSLSSLKLNEAVEEFSRKIHRAMQAPQKILMEDKWEHVAKQINRCLWNYAEELEGCVVELFQQIELSGFEHWNVDVVRAATSIKDELSHRLDGLIWAIRRLDQHLRFYRKACRASRGIWSGLKESFVQFCPLLDRSLVPTVRKCSKYLNFYYRKFVKRYTGYLQLYESGQQSLNKFYLYRVLSTMEINQQEKLKQFYFFLTLWEENQKARILPRAEPMRALRSFISYESANALFKDYFYAIREAIFDKSRIIKNQFRFVFEDKKTKNALADNLENYGTELKELRRLIMHYKKFLLETTSRKIGFLRRMFHLQLDKYLLKHGDELDKLTQEISNLGNIQTSFISSLESDSNTQKGLTEDFQNGIDKYLHEMAQPLASKNMLRRNAKSILHSLQTLHEISAFDPQVVEYISLVLCHMMCLDWKYHVLQKLPSFHQIYEIHCRIFDVSHERTHINRLHKFQRIINQLENWIKNEEAVRHSQEIDLDINDIKAYLQDFFAYVQRLEPENPLEWEDDRFARPSSQAAQMLLQYLALFATFFSHLDSGDSEHRLIRKRLLFVDQYFEAIHNKIKLVIAL